MKFLFKHFLKWPFFKKKKKIILQVLSIIITTIPKLIHFKNLLWLSSLKPSIKTKKKDILASMNFNITATDVSKISNLTMWSKLCLLAPARHWRIITLIDLIHVWIQLSLTNEWRLVDSCVGKWCVNRSLWNQTVYAASFEWSDSWSKRWWWLY